MWPKLANAVGYQCVWLCCVVGAGSAHAWLGPLAACLFAVLMIVFGGKARSDLRMVVVAVPLGFAFDSALAASGCLHYAQAWPSTMLAPAWIGALWLGFALTLNHSLAFLRQKPMLSATLGLIGGPLAYFSAERGFHAVVIATPRLPAMLMLAIGWAILVPLLFRLDKKINSHAATGVVA